ncbi:phytoene/squalene synthase family protein [Magnetospirillum sp. SS-4]|uniref:phytoene/squalene synthase family protein n=1 Tax=Magnetospirillum sp. SS-4 TaxID=2681465 RepID=UPI001384FCAB|nr:phytoene/squalene synthase family protein [Magnetospirillum sp. SS-4]CAA7613891.1 Phytoene/squalene synthetase [Magnetospirillum sp. SS-4]
MPHSPDLTDAARLVRDFDRDRFVTALFAPPDRREELMLLYAFNVEIARVRESVREPMAGMIRLQWWRDTLAAAVGDGGHHHSVAAPLTALIRRLDLPPGEFERLLLARERDLDAEGPPDMDAVLSYAEESSSVLTGLALRVLGANAEADHVAGRHVGIAWALVGQLRALGFHLSIGRLTLPETILRETGTDGQAVRDGRASPQALARTARVMAAVARDHLDKARSVALSRTALPALLPAILADGYLDALAGVDCNPFHPAFQRVRTRPLALAWANLRGRI